MDIDGLGPLDWILEILVDFLDEFFRVGLLFEAPNIYFVCPGLDQGHRGRPTEGPPPGLAQQLPS